MEAFELRNNTKEVYSFTINKKIFELFSKAVPHYKKSETIENLIKLYLGIKETSSVTSKLGRVKPQSEQKGDLTNV